MGDLFLRDEAGRVWWLDVGLGQLESLADDEQEFAALLTDPDNVRVLFADVLVDALDESGLTRALGECYSYLVLPVLGGKYELDNFRVCDIVTHFQVFGPIHEKIKDLPDGTEVQFKVGE
jgi:hypothetical protein